MSKRSGKSFKTLSITFSSSGPTTIRYIEEFARVGADIITVHYESTVHLDRTLAQINDTLKDQTSSIEDVLRRHQVLKIALASFCLDSKVVVIREKMKLKQDKRNDVKKLWLAVLPALLKE